MKSKTKQILAAIIFMLLMWVIGPICRGELFLADSMTLSVLTQSAEDFLSPIYPYFFALAVIAAIVVSAINKKKAFAITTAIMTAIPFLSLGIIFIIQKLFPEGSMLLVPFMFLAAPTGAVIG